MMTFEMYFRSFPNSSWIISDLLFDAIREVNVILTKYDISTDLKSLDHVRVEFYYINIEVCIFFVCIQFIRT